MDEEPNIQDYLKSLLDGEQSPDFDSEKWYYLYHINKLTTIEIGEIHCYTVKLFHSLNHYFSESSKVDMIARIDFKGEYKIIDELIVDYTERGNPTIANFISAKEVNKEDPLYCTYDSLYYDVIESKDISKYDVNYYDAIAYNDTFKLKLYLFKDKVSQWSFNDIRYNYYELTLPKRIEKYRIDLEKACTKKEIDINLEIISFYINKFNSISNDSTDKNIALCYGLIEEKLEELHHRLNKYFAVGRNKKTYNKKLEWNGTLDEFFEFINPYIEDDSIVYKGMNDIYAIYKVLLSHFDIKDQPNIQDETICNNLNISIPSVNRNVEIIKLEWTESVSELLKFLKPKFAYNNIEKSKFLYNGKAEKKGVATKINDIFSVKKLGKYNINVSDSSLIQTLRENL